MPELSSEQKEMLAKQKENCPFCKIIAGEIPSKQVFEDDQVIALLDIHPAVPGHVLVMPKEHYPIMPLMPEETFAHLFKIVRELSAKLREAMLVSRTTIFIANGYAAGQNSQHFLFHIIPREEVDSLDMLYFKEKEIQEDKYNEAYKILSHNIPIMLRNRYKLFPIEGKEAPKLKYTVEQVRQIIEKNPKLKELIQQSPYEFRKLAMSHEQLKPIFAEVNVDEVIKEYVKDYNPNENAGDVNKSKMLLEKQKSDEKDESELIEDNAMADNAMEDNAMEDNVMEDNVMEETKEEVIGEVKDEAEEKLEEDLIDILNSNPKLKSLLINDFETFKQKVDEISQLKELFSEADLVQLRKRIIEEEKIKNKKITDESRKGMKSTEEKSEDDVDLNDITRLLS